MGISSTIPWESISFYFGVYIRLQKVLSHSPYHSGASRGEAFLIESNFLFGSLVGCEVSLLFKKLKVIPWGDQKRQNKSKRDGNGGGGG